MNIESQLNCVLKIIQNKSQFYTFENESRKLINNILIELDRSECDQNKLALYYHTLNGSFLSYYLSDLSGLNKSLEETLQKSKLTMAQKKALKDKTSLLQESFEVKIATLKKELSLSQEVFEVNKEEMDKLLKDHSSSSQTALYKDLTHLIYTTSLEELLHPYNQFLKEMAKELGKEILPLTLHNSHLKVNRHRFNHFFLSLNHLLRNALDHGIEKPSERKELNKNPAGKIEIQANINNDILTLIIKDDGRGIDTQTLKETNPNFSDDELLSLIFTQGFSLNDKASQYSGMGQGMKILKDAAEKLQGKILIKSEINKGTEFKFQLPIH